MIDEKNVDNLLSELKKEIMSRESYSLEVVTHSQERESFPEVGETLDGALIVYLDGSNRKRLAEDIVDRDLKDKIAKIMELPSCEDTSEQESGSKAVSLVDVLEILKDLV